MTAAVMACCTTLHLVLSAQDDVVQSDDHPRLTTTKQTVVGLKKSYLYLAEIGLVEASEYQEFLAKVKSKMPEWLGRYPRDL